MSGDIPVTNTALVAVLSIAVLLVIGSYYVDRWQERRRAARRTVAVAEEITTPPEVEKSERGTDRRCAVCHDPLPWGTAHYCHRTSEYREEVAA